MFSIIDKIGQIAGIHWSTCTLYCSNCCQSFPTIGIIAPYRFYAAESSSLIGQVSLLLGSSPALSLEERTIEPPTFPPIIYLYLYIAIQFSVHILHSIEKYFIFVRNTILILQYFYFYFYLMLLSFNILFLRVGL